MDVVAMLCMRLLSGYKGLNPLVYVVERPTFCLPGAPQWYAATWTLGSNLHKLSCKFVGENKELCLCVTPEIRNKIERPDLLFVERVAADLYRTEGRRDRDYI
jgi:hypothetical protein